jgi:hypothetical protein
MYIYEYICIYKYIYIHIYVYIYIYQRQLEEIPLNDEEGMAIIDDISINALSSSASTPQPVVTKSGFSVPMELKELSYELGYNDALELFRKNSSSGVVLSKKERGQGEGALRGKILKGILAHDEWSKAHIVLRNMAAEDVMATAFRQAYICMYIHKYRFKYK